MGQRQRRDGRGRSCGKHRYPTGPAARTALAGIRSRSYRYQGDEPKPTRAYPCELCDGWHLTHEPQ